MVQGWYQDVVFLTVFSYFMVKVRIPFVLLCEINVLDWMIINLCIGRKKTKQNQTQKKRAEAFNLFAVFLNTKCESQI